MDMSKATLTLFIREDWHSSGRRQHDETQTGRTDGSSCNGDVSLSSEPGLHSGVHR